VRRLLAGLASILLALFINQVSSLIDFSWGVYAAVASAVIGYGLLLTAEPTRHLVWSGLGRTHPLDIVLAVALITGALGGTSAWFLIKQEEARALQNRVRNGGFENGTDFWGTGYLEDRIRSDNVAEGLKRLPYIISGDADSQGGVDTTDRHSGVAAFRFDHGSAKADNSWGSLSQRITRLRPRTSYAATFWALVSRAEPKPLFLTTDLQWATRTYVENEIAGWREYRHVFNTGDSDHIDLRFVIEAPGTVWIDDVALRELTQ
jgi:hypothetical protein